ncbi:unnamed protein product [Bathycoccus prasinos]
MQAQDALYKGTVGDGQAAEILADLNANNIENRAPINHVDSYMRKDMLAENKPFDDTLLDGIFSSHGEA